MVQTALPQNVSVSIQGDITGQVAVGDYNIQIGSIYGGVVNIPDLRPKIEPLPVPVLIRPRAFSSLLDREVELNRVNAALRSNAPAEFCGQDGIGKTVLLRHIAHSPVMVSFPDGVVHRSVRHWDKSDILQFLFDAFYQTTIKYKPTDGEICRYLQEKQALILLDDVELPRQEVESLLDAAPGCTFVLAARERHLWGGECAVSLSGLPLDDALTLLERELGRLLSSAERPTAQTLCTALNGHPLRILQSAAMVRDDGLTIEEVTQRILPTKKTEKQVLGVLPATERQVLVTLAAAGGAFLHPDHINRIIGSGDAATALESLLHRGLVQADGSRFSVGSDLVKTIRQMWDLTVLAERAMAYFITWAEGLKDTPERLLEDVDAILRLLAWGVGAKRWSEVIGLGRAIDSTLVLGKRWGAWAQVLQWVLQAAQALDNRLAQAWALHQAGTRALCLGEKLAARKMLTRALQLRETLGDRVGAAITRHNLQFLFPVVPPERSPKPVPARVPVPAAVVPFLGEVAIALLAVLLWVWAVPAAYRYYTSILSLTVYPALTSTPLLTAPISTSAATVPAATSTPTPIPAVTSTPTPSPTYPLPPTDTPEPTPCPCGVPPVDWVSYQVQPQDSIYALARRYSPDTPASLRQMVDQITYYNCLCPGTLLRVGQWIYVPFLSTPTPTLTPIPPLSAPSELSVSTMTDSTGDSYGWSDSRVWLEWQDNAPDESNYVIERSVNVNTNWTEIARVDSNVINYYDQSADCGTVYYYRVRAYRASDGRYSGYSNEASVTTGACFTPASPTAPSDLSVAQITSQKQIVLRWKDNASDESGYDIERSLDGSTNWTRIGSVNSNVTYYSDVGLDCYSTYYYRVRAFRTSDGRNSDYSNIAYDTTACSPPSAQILRPADGTAVYDQVTFLGKASDPEDDDSRLTVEWFSDIDGFLGSGLSMTVSLSAHDCFDNYHTITLRVTDSDGKVTEDSITVRTFRECPG